MFEIFVNIVWLTAVCSYARRFPDKYDICSFIKPCRNGATCNEDLLSRFNCTCAPGFEGFRCESNTDECASNPCQNNATCTDEINGYTCTCALGFEGPNCENNTDECASNPCQNNATCYDGVNEYSCSCDSGFEGTHCENNTNEYSSRTNMVLETSAESSTSMLHATDESLTTKKPSDEPFATTMSGRFLGDATLLTLGTSRSLANTDLAQTTKDTMMITAQFSEPETAKPPDKTTMAISESTLRFSPGFEESRKPDELSTKFPTLAESGSNISTTHPSKSVRTTASGSNQIVSTSKRQISETISLITVLTDAQETISATAKTAKEAQTRVEKPQTEPSVTQPAIVSTTFVLQGKTGSLGGEKLPTTSVSSPTKQEEITLTTAEMTKSITSKQEMSFAFTSTALPVKFSTVSKPIEIGTHVSSETQRTGITDTQVPLITEDNQQQKTPESEITTSGIPVRVTTAPAVVGSQLSTITEAPEAVKSSRSGLTQLHHTEEPTETRGTANTQPPQRTIVSEIMTSVVPVAVVTTAPEALGSKLSTITEASGAMKSSTSGLAQLYHTGEPTETGKTANTQPQRTVVMTEMTKSITSNQEMSFAFSSTAFPAEFSTVSKPIEVGTHVSSETQWIDITDTQVPLITEDNQPQKTPESEIMTSAVPVVGVTTVPAVVGSQFSTITEAPEAVKSSRSGLTQLYHTEEPTETRATAPQRTIVSEIMTSAVPVVGVTTAPEALGSQLSTITEASVAMKSSTSVLAQLYHTGEPTETGKTANTQPKRTVVMTEMTKSITSNQEISFAFSSTALPAEFSTVSKPIEVGTHVSSETQWIDITDTQVPLITEDNQPQKTPESEIKTSGIVVGVTTVPAVVGSQLSTITEAPEAVKSSRSGLTQLYHTEEPTETRATANTQPQRITVSEIMTSAVPVVGVTTVPAVVGSQFSTITEAPEAVKSSRSGLTQLYHTEEPTETRATANTQPQRTIVSEIMTSAVPVVGVTTAPEALGTQLSTITEASVAMKSSTSGLAQLYHTGEPTETGKTANTQPQRITVSEIMTSAVPVVGVTTVPAVVGSQFSTITEAPEAVKSSRSGLTQLYHTEEPTETRATANTQPQRTIVSEIMTSAVPVVGVTTAPEALGSQLSTITEASVAMKSSTSGLAQLYHTGEPTETGKTANTQPKRTVVMTEMTKSITSNQEISFAFSSTALPAEFSTVSKPIEVGTHVSSETQWIDITDTQVPLITEDNQPQKTPESEIKTSGIVVGVTTVPAVVGSQLSTITEAPEAVKSSRSGLTQLYHTEEPTETRATANTQPQRTTVSEIMTSVVPVVGVTTVPVVVGSQLPTITETPEAIKSSRSGLAQLYHTVEPMETRATANTQPQRTTVSEIMTSVVPVVGVTTVPEAQESQLSTITEASVAMKSSTFWLAQLYHTGEATETGKTANTQPQRTVVMTEMTKSITSNQEMSFALTSTALPAKLNTVSKPIEIGTHVSTETQRADITDTQVPLITEDKQPQKTPESEITTSGIPVGLTTVQEALGSQLSKVTEASVATKSSTSGLAQLYHTGEPTETGKIANTQPQRTVVINKMTKPITFNQEMSFAFTSTALPAKFNTVPKPIEVPATQVPLITEENQPQKTPESEITTSGILVVVITAPPVAGSQLSTITEAPEAVKMTQFYHTVEPMETRRTANTQPQRTTVSEIMTSVKPLVGVTTVPDAHGPQLSTITEASEAMKSSTSGLTQLYHTGTRQTAKVSEKSVGVSHKSATSAPFTAGPMVTTEATSAVSKPATETSILLETKSSAFRSVGPTEATIAVLETSASSNGMASNTVMRTMSMVPESNHTTEKSPEISGGSSTSAVGSAVITGATRTAWSRRTGEPSSVFDSAEPTIPTVTIAETSDAFRKSSAVNDIFKITTEVRTSEKSGKTTDGHGTALISGSTIETDVTAWTKQAGETTDVAETGSPSLFRALEITLASSGGFGKSKVTPASLNLSEKSVEISDYHSTTFPAGTVLTTEIPTFSGTPVQTTELSAARSSALTFAQETAATRLPDTAVTDTGLAESIATVTLSVMTESEGPSVNKNLTSRIIGSGKVTVPSAVTPTSEDTQSSLLITRPVETMKPMNHEGTGTPHFQTGPSAGEPSQIGSSISQLEEITETVTKLRKTTTSNNGLAEWAPNTASNVDETEGPTAGGNLTSFVNGSAAAKGITDPGLSDITKRMRTTVRSKTLAPISGSEITLQSSGKYKTNTTNTYISQSEKANESDARSTPSLASKSHTTATADLTNTPAGTCNMNNQCTFYFKGSNKNNIVSASEFCSINGGWLAHVTSKEQHDAVVQCFSPFTRDLAVGLRDAPELTDILESHVWINSWDSNGRWSGVPVKSHGFYYDHILTPLTDREKQCMAYQAADNMIHEINCYQDFIDREFLCQKMDPSCFPSSTSSLSTTTSTEAKSCDVVTAGCHIFYKGNTTKSIPTNVWDAMRMCESNGGRLAHIVTKSDHDEIKNCFSPFSSRLFVGLFDDSRENDFNEFRWSLGLNSSMTDKTTAPALKDGYYMHFIKGILSINYHDEKHCTSYENDGKNNEMIY